MFLWFSQPPSLLPNMTLIVPPDDPCGQLTKSRFHRFSSMNDAVGLDATRLLAWLNLSPPKTHRQHVSCLSLFFWTRLAFEPRSELALPTVCFYLSGCLIQNRSVFVEI